MNKSWVFISGASGKLSKHIAIYLAKQNYNLLLHYNSNTKNANSLINTLSKYNIECKLIKADFTKIESARIIINSVLKEYKPQIVLNTASTFKRIPFRIETIDNIQNSLNINLLLPYFIIQEFSKISSSACIINFLDRRIIQSSSPFAVYLIAKKQLSFLTKNIQLENDNRINAISLNVVELEDSDLTKIEKNIIMNKNKITKLSSVYKAIDYIISNKNLNNEVINI